MRWMSPITLLATALFSLLPMSAAANIQLSPIFSDGAILQHGRPVPVWGMSKPHTTLRITLGNESREIQSSATGSWEVEFSARPAGEKSRLEIKASNNKTIIENILFGDVWLCGGQSNMEWVLRDTENAQQEINDANIPDIRQFKVSRGWTIEPENQLSSGKWHSATSKHVADFSAVGYYFAKEVNKQTDIPQGLISSNWGGSRIEAWMSSAALGETPEDSKMRLQKIKDQFADENSLVKKRFARWPGSLQKKYADTGIDWSAFDLDTHDWTTLHAPKLWEQQGFTNIDGIIWYRKDFDLTENQLNGDIEIGLGRIDDADTTWVNGVRIGATQAYNVARQYTIPKSALRVGRNNIAVRIEDFGGGGGIYSNDELVYLQFASGARQSLVGEWLVKPESVMFANNSGMRNVPAALYNKMIHPLFRTPIKGVIWYQGESNANNVEEAQQYAELFQALIHDWRAAWQQPKMPFYWVQLASFNSKRDSQKGSPWAILRQSQTAALHLPVTGQAITIDVGESDDIHPRDKRTVGNRLAYIALNNTYGLQTHYRGPYVVSAVQQDQQLTVRFHTASGLTTDDSGAAKGFSVFDKDGNQTALNGVIQGKSVVFDLKDLTIQPVSLGYGWKDDALDANLRDNKGLPAEPARVILAKPKAL